MWEVGGGGGGVFVTQSCLTLCNPVDCSLPGFSVHGISQGRMLEWGVTSFFRGSSWPRDWTWNSCIASRFFTSEPPGRPVGGGRQWQMASLPHSTPPKENQQVLPSVSNTALMEPHQEGDCWLASLTPFRETLIRVYSLKDTWDQ